MIPTYLHIGATKTGSSSLQYALTRQPVRSRIDGAIGFEYVAIRSGMTLRGNSLREFASNFAAFYGFSADLPELLAQDDEAFGRTNAFLSQLRNAGVAPILSYEGWLINARELVHRFTARLSCPLHVVVYVRPPVDWLNSWFLERWRDTSRPSDDWIHERLPRVNWDELIENWRSAPNVARVDVRAWGPSVVEDFCAVVGCQPPQHDLRENQTLSTTLMSYLHGSSRRPIVLSEIKYIYSRWIADQDRSVATPFVLNLEQVRHILAWSRAHNERLLELCDAPTRSQIEGESRWWTAEAYECRLSDPDLDANPNPTQSNGCVGRDEAMRDDLVWALLRALSKADSAWRKASVEREREHDVTT
jgi:hypothetical protein